MNKNLVVIVAVVLGLILLGGAVFAVAKFGSRVQQALQQAPSSTATTSGTPSQANVTPPSQVTLKITSPIDKTVVNTSSVKVSGTTVPGAEVAINETNLKADANGVFSTDLKLDEGDNPIVIDVFDADGNSNSADLTVTYEP